MNVFHETQVPWPHDKKPLNKARTYGQFKASNIGAAAERVESEVCAFSKATWRTKELWIYANGKLGARNRFLANVNTTDHPEVVVSFDLDGRSYTIPCDAFRDAIQNLCAIAETIKGLRAQERYGVMTIQEMLTNYAALPGASEKAWWKVLGVQQASSLADCEAQYRRLVKKLHPDLPTGDADKFREANDAIEIARKVCK